MQEKTLGQPFSLVPVTAANFSLVWEMLFKPNLFRDAVAKTVPPACCRGCVISLRIFYWHHPLFHLAKRKALLLSLRGLSQPFQVRVPWLWQGFVRLEWMLNCMGGFHGRNLQDFLQNPWTFARNKASENERHHRQAGGDEAATRGTTPLPKNATKREGAWKGSHFIVKLGHGKLCK